MPIYAYRCDDCGHQQDFLQKVSDAPIAACPACGSASFKKQLTAPAFQLKGTGWYVTDFRQPAAGANKPGDAATDSAKDSASSSSSATSDSAASSAGSAQAGSSSSAAPDHSASNASASSSSTSASPGAA